MANDTVSRDPLVGRTLGRYSILGQLGFGGMGVVYRAHDERLARDVALKFLPSGPLVDDSDRRRFRNEALALAKLNHPNIATIFELETLGDTDFLVMECIHGHTLDEMLLHGPLQETEIRRLGEQLAAGLSVAHEAGVLHRDLKPANIRVTPQGLLKILDFGLAKLLDMGKAAATIDATTISKIAPQGTGFAGTPPYMAPEQLSQGLIDARTDIYGAGAVLYEMACGRRAFIQDTLHTLVQAILHSQPTPPRKLARMSPALEAIILKALAKDPAQRQQSARELQEELRRLASAPSRRRSRSVDSVAVLPFENATGDPQADYLSEGITEMLIHSLSTLPEFKKVIARNSVYRYRELSINPEQAGRELDVRSVLIGRMLRRGSAIVISAELVDPADSRHLWGAQYERKENDIAGLPRAIADDIAIGLGIKVEARKTKGSHAPPPARAYQLYLKGRYFWSKRPAAGMVQKAIEYFEQASEANPKFALAYAGLADCYNTLGAWEASAMAPQHAFPQAKMAAKRALRLDPQLPEAHTAEAYSALHFDWDWQRSQQCFQRALQLNPNYVHAHHWCAHFLVAAGRSEEALAESLRIIELDPLDLVMNVHLAWHYQMTHRYLQALETAQKTLELEPNFHWGYFFTGLAYEQLKELDKAVDCLARSVQLSGDSTVMKAALGHAYARSGDQAAARRILEELRALTGARYVSPYELGLIHLALEETEQGWQLLEQACAEHSGWMPYLRAEPRLLHLHGDARFQGLLARVALPAETFTPAQS